MTRRLAVIGTILLFAATLFGHTSVLAARCTPLNKGTCIGLQELQVLQALLEGRREVLGVQVIGMSGMRLSLLVVTL